MSRSSSSRVADGLGQAALQLLPQRGRRGRRPRGRGTGRPARSTSGRPRRPGTIGCSRSRLRRWAWRCRRWASMMWSLAMCRSQRWNGMAGLRDSRPSRRLASSSTSWTMSLASSAAGQRRVEPQVDHAPQRLAMRLAAGDRRRCGRRRGPGRAVRGCRANRWPCLTPPEKAYPARRSSGGCPWRSAPPREHGACPGRRNSRRRGPGCRARRAGDSVLRP